MYLHIYVYCISWVCPFLWHISHLHHTTSILDMQTTYIFNQVPTCFSRFFKMLSDANGQKNTKVPRTICGTKCSCRRDPFLEMWSESVNSIGLYFNAFALYAISWIYCCSGHHVVFMLYNAYQHAGTSEFGLDQDFKWVNANVSPLPNLPLCNVPFTRFAGSVMSAKKARGQVVAVGFVNDFWLFWRVKLNNYGTG